MKHAKPDAKRILAACRRGADAGPKAVSHPGSVQSPMAKATISARSGRMSGGCTASWKRAKPDAKSDHFPARSGRRSGGCYVSLKRTKPGAKKRRIRRGEQRLHAPAGQREARVACPCGFGGGTKVNRNGERKRSSVIFRTTARTGLFVDALLPVSPSPAAPSAASDTSS